MGKIDLKPKPIRRLQSTFSEAELPPEDLPMIYIRATIDKRIAVWPAHRMELDPRPNELAIYFNTMAEAEKMLPKIMEATGKFYGVCYLYIDQMK